MDQEHVGGTEFNGACAVGGGHDDDDDDDER